MKKTFKGFTLVECLVAMAILAIASTLMAGIYASVATRNKFNHFNNTSLANQMAHIEKYENASTLAINYGGSATYKDTEITSNSRKPPHEHVSSNSSTTAYVKIQKLDSSGNVVTSESFGSSCTGNPTYSFPVDIYVMYSRDTYDTSSNEATYSQVFSEQNDNLRYKYILGHTS